MKQGWRGEYREGAKIERGGWEWGGVGEGAKGFGEWDGRRM